MYTVGCFNISVALKKVEGPYSRDMVDPETGKPLWVNEDMLVAAPPDYPQLAEGLEIGALYQEVPGPDGCAGFLHYLDSLEDYCDWCEKLVSLVTNGKKLRERPTDEVEWSNKLSELVVDTEQYPETGGRGPFWELLRYGLRGMTFGPVVCQKLATDFEKWKSAADTLGDSEFSSWYSHVWSTFLFAGDAGRVTSPWGWTEDMEPKLGIETLKLFQSPDDYDDAAGDIDDSDDTDDADDSDGADEHRPAGYYYDDI